MVQLVALSIFSDVSVAVFPDASNVPTQSNVFHIGTGVGLS
jgi:hypothetical protein